MELTMVKDGYDAYLKEIKKRDELVKAIVNNDDYTNIQLEYVDLYEKTNEELGKIIDKIAIEDFLMLISNINEDMDYRDFVEFLLLLLSYITASKFLDNAQKIEERESALYLDVMKWHAQNQSNNESDREGLMVGFRDAAKDSISVRNILANREELNSIFEGPIYDNEESKMKLIKIFGAKIDVQIGILSFNMLLSALTHMNTHIPKPILINLVALNVLTKEYNLGFCVEEYVERAFNNRDVLKEMFGVELNLERRVLDDFIENLQLEINDATNEYINYKEKGNAY